MKELILANLPFIGGILYLIGMSAFNYATKHHDEIKSPFWKALYALLVHMPAFLDKNGYRGFLKIPVFGWPKPPVTPEEDETDEKK